MAFYPTNQEEVDADYLLSEERCDVCKTLQSREYNINYAIFKLVYSNINDKLFFILGNKSNVSIGTVGDLEGNIINRKFLQALFIEYKIYFIESSHNDITESDPTFLSASFGLWRQLHEIFITPLIGITEHLPYKEVLFMFNIKLENEDMMLNLSLIHDLYYSYVDTSINLPLYFTHISLPTVLQYMQELPTMPVPKIENIEMLNGLERRYPIYKDDPDIPRDRLQTLKFRESMIDTMSMLLEFEGGKYKKLKSMDDVDSSLSNSTQERVIQLVAHFHDGTISSDDCVIELKQLLQLIDKKKQLNSLNEHLILDATTCNNFHAFKELKKAGIRYLFYSTHDLSTDQAIYTLFEFYSNRIASKLGWKTPYLDGRRHLHTIYSDINRAFFVYMRKWKKIDLPNANEKAIILEGPDISYFHQYLNHTQSRKNYNGEEICFSHKLKFEVSENNHSDDVLIRMLLIGHCKQICQLVSNYVTEDRNKDVTLKTKDENGDDIILNLSNVTEEEIRQLLKGTFMA